MACLFVSADFHQADGLGADAFFPALKGQSFGGGGLYIYPADGEPQSVGGILPHLRDIGQKLGSLSDNGDVRVGDPGTLIEQE